MSNRSYRDFCHPFLLKKIQANALRNLFLVSQRTTACFFGIRKEEKSSEVFLALDCGQG
jgi:hypothetical protein